jgi:hypothetical protein
MLKDILIHNGIYSDTMSEEQFERWVQVHLVIISKVSQITGEKL